jgi:hypothetical protein
VAVAFFLGSLYLRIYTIFDLQLILRSSHLRQARERQDVKKLNFSLESIKIDFVKLDWK